MMAAARQGRSLGGVVVLCAAMGGCAPAPETAPPAGDAAAFAFRNAVTEPPTGWAGPVFQLSRDYPATHPGECPRSVCTWLDASVTFTTPSDSVPPDWTNGPWADYIGRILTYVRQGQDPQLSNEAGFRVQVDGATRWFHVPWMAYDPTAGREFVHGTTNERTAHLADLVGDGVGFGTHLLTGTSTSCTEANKFGFESWSVGFYNEWGAWSIGQAFGSDGRPRIGVYLGSAMPGAAVP